MSFYVLVMDVEPDNAFPQWTTSYALYGPFADEKSAQDHASTIPPLKDGGVHSLTKVLPPGPGDGAWNTSFALLMRSDNWDGKGTPRMWPRLYGPFSDDQAAAGFTKQHTDNQAAGAVVMGMVLDAVDPVPYTPPDDHDHGHHHGQDGPP